MAAAAAAPRRLQGPGHRTGDWHTPGARAGGCRGAVSTTTRSRGMAAMPGAPGMPEPPATVPGGAQGSEWHPPKHPPCQPHGGWQHQHGGTGAGSRGGITAAPRASAHRSSLWPRGPAWGAGHPKPRADPLPRVPPPIPRDSQSPWTVPRALITLLHGPHRGSQGLAGAGTPHPFWDPLCHLSLAALKGW